MRRHQALALRLAAALLPAGGAAANQDAAAVAAIRAELAARPPAAIGAAFDVLDADADGRLGATELPPSSIAALDSPDADREVDPAELASAIARHWSRPPLSSGLLAEYWIWRMAQAAESGGAGAALAIGEQALAEVGPDYRLCQHVGWLALGAGRLALAEHCAAEARFSEPSAGDVWCLEAEIRLARGDLAGAIALLESKVELPSYRLCARLTLARLYAAGGRPGDARRILDAAVASPPSSSRDAFRAHQQLARLNLELNDVQAAGLHALRAVALHRVDGSGWALLASFLESAEGAPEAVDRARSLAVEIRAQQAPGRRGGAR